MQTETGRGFGRSGGGLCAATAAVLFFGNLAACLCSPFLILASLLLPGEFCYHPYIYQSFSAVPVRPPFFLTSPPTPQPIMDLLGIWWEAGARDVRWADSVFTCCLARLWELSGGVWRQKGRVCEVSVWMKTEAPRFPPTHTLHILTKESHSVGQTVPDTCEDNPSCAPFIPPCLSSLFFTLSVFLFPSVT